MNKVSILLSTYNGEKYLEEQILSLLEQQDVKVNIVVRDDGSTDKTIAILSDYSDRGLLSWYSGENLGPLGSFMHLLFNVECSDYYAFCDQDDVWMPNKLSVCLAKMQEVEEKCSYSMPIIVHSDMRVVDKSLNTIADSFWKMEKLSPSILKTFKYLAVCNGVNGCTMLLNNMARTLIKSKYFEQKTVIHDVLSSLIVAANGGIIEYVNIPTVLYRQHENNVVGARSAGLEVVKKKIFNIVDVITENVDHYKTVSKIGNISVLEYLYCKISYYFKERL